MTSFPLKSGASQGHPLHQSFLTQYLEDPELNSKVTVTRQEKEIKGIEREKAEFLTPTCPLSLVQPLMIQNQPVVGGIEAEI